MRTWCPELRAQRLGVRDCVSSSLNTQPLQPDVQLRQQLELVYQIIVFTNPIGSISSTLSILHYCVECCSYLCLKTLTEDSHKFLSSISSVCLSSSCVILCLRYLYSVLVFISSWWLLLCSAMFTFEYLFHFKCNWACTVDLYTWYDAFKCHFCGFNPWGIESALYRLEGGWIGDFYEFFTEEFVGDEIP